jgi:hypothetical protein
MPALTLVFDILDPQFRAGVGFEGGGHISSHKRSATVAAAARGVCQDGSISDT